MSFENGSRTAKKALDGVRVLDLTDTLSVYATRVLADLGADVIRIELPAGDPMREVPPLDSATGASLFYTFMNLNKRAVALDLEVPAGRELFVKLASEVAIVVESLGAPRCAELSIDPDAIRHRNPELVWTRTSPFGSDGPRAHWRADDLISQAAGGLARLSGLPEREPLRLFGEQTSYIAGLHAATASMIALLHAEATGEGQNVDVSIQECIAHTLENAIQFYSAEGVVREREGGNSEGGVGLFRCTDGLIYIYASAWMMRDSWHSLVEWMVEAGIDGAENLREERWLDLDYRKKPEVRDYLRELIETLTVRRTKKQLYEEAQRRRILVAPLNTVPDLIKNPQLAFFDWFRGWPLPHGRTATISGPPVRLSETPMTLRAGAPRPGEQTGAVLSQLAKLGDDELARLRREGVIAT